MIVYAVRGEQAAPIDRQSSDLPLAAAIAWECYAYDQASGTPQADDYQVRALEARDIPEEHRTEDVVVTWYSAARDGAPAHVLCARCHQALVTADGALCSHCR